MPCTDSLFTSRDASRWASSNLGMAYVTRRIPEAKARLYEHTSGLSAMCSMAFTVLISIAGACLGSSFDATSAAGKTNRFAIGQFFAECSRPNCERVFSRRWDIARTFRYRLEVIAYQDKGRFAS